ncbi:Rpn family recombination-promoting nuclease/putative transposase [Dorea acetigenes]|uniref:Rpn family recombination-promoting nuclease/putative transposase n=1 Tax=Dorea acetigenes TaxID=2981787 RepID=A0ABT2RRQ1_9FIRM|nr:Rpn family recombination-promoting nuclease/putative transposase [Dorea acetigenes]MCB6415553.1 Rpn family recombination-promoting nuclease/putative transposase [Faecalimonas umbilicata]MCU6688036.1 Rpn family recombination-promoting nuclease/putative transposase [Dorea acetigenes]
MNPLGVKDTVTTKYMRQNEIFADAFNYFVYGGEQVINPESLEELDTREIDVPYGGEKGAKQPVQKTRDVIKSVIAMMDKRTAYLLLAIENQSNIHYAMPVKNMVYDALQYAKQVEEAAASHKLSGDYKGVDSDEYLSGFMKADHLLPVVTLVIYFASKEWDGPLSIHEMFAGQDARVLAFVPDYKINLIAPAAIEDSEFEKFQTTLKEVLSFIKYSGNADKLQEVIGIDEKFRHLGRNEVDVLNACVNANLTMKKGEEVLDVCQAIQTIADRAAEQKRMDTLLDNVKKLMERMGWSAEQSMDVLSIPESDRNSLAQRLK